MKNRKSSITLNSLPLALTIALVVFGLVAITSPARAQSPSKISTLPTLTTYSSLIPGPSGTFFGVSNEGNIGNCDLGCGSVFQLSLTSGGTWTRTILHTFTGLDGAWPQSRLILDSAGNVYGTTIYGGATYGGTNRPCLSNGCGVAFELSRRSRNTWAETVLHSFTGAKDGWLPTGLAFGASGSLVGTTQLGGNSAHCSDGCGVVFQLARDSAGHWQETLLLAFAGGSGGQSPLGLTLDRSGNIFGTAGGGLNTCFAGYCGIVFELSQNSSGWKESVVYRFHGSDGEVLNPSLTLDAGGNIYGTTYEGGTACVPTTLTGCGTVFELSHTGGIWSETVLHDFTDLTDGEFPTDGLVFDAAGNLYGGTSNGGDVSGCNPFVFGACGQIFKLAPSSGSWTITAEYSAPGWLTPVGDLLVDASGTVFGAVCDEVYFSGGFLFEITK